MNSAERIRFHRQRILDISGRLKYICEANAAAGQIESTDNMNQDNNLTYVNDEQIDNDAINKYFDEICEVNDNENEYEELKNNNSNNESNSCSDIDNMNRNDNLTYVNDEHIDNDAINEYFDEIYEVNNNENEYEELNSSNSSNEHDSDSDRGIDFRTDTEDEDDNNNNIPLYPNSFKTLRQAYTAIKAFIIKCNLTFTHILYLISLLLFLLPSGHRLTRSGIVNAADGKCLSTCILYGSKRTADSLTELCIANVFDRTKCVVKRNLSLILEYQKRANHILPNDIVNSSVYNKLHQDSKYHRLTLMIHCDGIQMITTKSKKFYVVTGTLLEIPPPLLRQDYFVEFKKIYLNVFNETITTDFPLFCRFVRGTLKFNSLMYSRIGSRLSNIVSFKDNRCPVNKSKCFGIIIWYFNYHSENYAFIKRLTCTNAVLRTQRNDQFATVAHDFIDRFYNLIDLNVFKLTIVMISRTKAITHVLFKTRTNDEDMIAPLDKCNITNDDTVEYRRGEHVYEGPLTTVGPKSFCDKLLKKMSGHSTDYLYSSLPDDDDEQDEDDGYLNGAKSTQGLNVIAGSIGSSSIIQIKSPTTAVSTNDSHVVQNIEPTTLSSAGNYSLESTSIQMIESINFAPMASNEVSIENLPGASTMSPLSAATKIHESETCEKENRNVHTPVSKKRSIPLLPSSSNKLSPGMRFISLYRF
ncbi:unnamed protein product [Rotaria sp. Silwood1]|nr:unnamed protein product [Rotaria sp. Silwood1]CAF1667303.1 unnamed protein product [Rotaria sp. Silwood1]